MKKIQGRILIIGAGAAGSVVAQKCAQQPDIFSYIHVASRRLSSCQTVQSKCQSPIHISQVDADKTPQVIQLIESTTPDIVINMALPYQDLSIMDACLHTGVHYIDTASYEPKDTAKFCYQWQWDYHEKFKSSRIMGLLGAGFDPGVTNVFCSYANHHLFDEIHHIDIIDCNAGDHGHPFATNFNPEINIREVTAPGKFYENGTWISVSPLSVSKDIQFPECGLKTAYLMYHEELESIVKHIPHIQSIRFWMTFSETYLTHLRVLQNVGLTNIQPINYQGQDIIPLQFLSHLLPKAPDLVEQYTGKTCIGCIISGIQNNQAKKILIYNVCDHEVTYKELQSHAVSFTTGVPAMIAAKLLVTGEWQGHGIFNMEQMNPDPFMQSLPQHGLPWYIQGLQCT